MLKVNPNKAPFDDKSVRQALRASIDKDKLTEDVFGDLGKPTPTMVPEGQLPAFPSGLGAADWEVRPAAAQGRGGEAAGRLEVGDDRLLGRAW